MELDKVVGDEVLQLDTDDRTGDVPKVNSDLATEGTKTA